MLKPVSLSSNTKARRRPAGSRNSNTAAAPDAVAESFGKAYAMAPVGIEQVALRDGRFLAVNPKLCDILGRTRAALLRTTFSKITHPDDLKREQNLIRQLRTGKLPKYTIEKRYRHQDGHWIWVRVTSAKAEQFNRGLGDRLSIVEEFSAHRRAQENEGRLAAIVESSDDAILSKDLSNRILTWNAAAERLLGYRADEMVGRLVTGLIPRDHLAEERALIKRIRLGQRIAHYQTIRRHKDKRLIEVSLSLSPLRTADGTIIGTSTIVRDVTERNRQQLALLGSEARTRAIISTAVDAIITIDRRGIIVSINPATERLFGYLATELIGKNVSALMPQPYRREHDGYLRNYVRTGLAKIIGIGREVTGQRKDGSTFPMSLAVSEMRLGQERMFTGIVHDLTARRQLERQVLNAAGNEQRRIGQDLHDGLCQELVSITLAAELLAGKLERAVQSDFAGEVRKLGEAVRDVAEQTRRLAHGLNPTDVDGRGLPEALEHFARRVSAASSVVCHFHCDQLAHAPNGTVATHLYRIAQEAVGNAIKHGKPSHIDVRLTGRTGSLTLRIEDDGVGMHTAHAPQPHAEPPSDSGMGMRTMSFRASLIGGTFNIRTAGNRGGTVVTCSVRYDPIGALAVRKA